MVLRTALVVAWGLALAGCLGPPPPLRRVAGVEATGFAHTVALQGDETSAVLAGKTLDVNVWLLRAFVELPIAQSDYAGLRLRVWAGLRHLEGTVDAVSLGDLGELAPGLADLLVDAADEFEGIPVLEQLAAGGEAAFDQNLADRFELRNIGVDLGATLVGAGPRLTLDGVAFELPEFGVGGFVEVSDVTIRLTGTGGRSTSHFFGTGIGVSLWLAPVVVYLPGGVRLQPIAGDVTLMGILAKGELRALVVAVSVGAQVGITF